MTTPTSETLPSAGDNGWQNVMATAFGVVNAAIDAAKDEMMTTLKKNRKMRLSQSKRIGAKIKQWLRLGS